MRKQYIYLGGIFVVAVLSIVFFMKDQEYFSPLKTSDIQRETYTRNITWDTDYRTDTPYNKGEQIEKVYVLKNQGGKPVNISIKREMFDYDIENSTIIVNDSTGVINSIIVQPEGAVVITVQGISKQSSTLEATQKIVNPQFEVLESSTGLISGNTQEKEQTGASLPIQEENQKVTISTISQNIFYSNIDNALQINVSYGKNVESVLIGEKSFVPVITENKIYVNIEKKTFSAGKYFLALVLKNGEIITAKDDIIFQLPINKINIVNITPDRIKNDSARFIVIQGNGLKNVVSVQLSNNVILTRTDFVPINDSVMGVKIPEKLEPGIYHLSIMDLTNIYEISDQTFTIY